MNSFWNANQKYGKAFLIASSLMIGLAILLSFKVYGYEETWKLWRVPVLLPQFSDFRLIPGSAESFREGIEPAQSNPGDPHGRIFNYPAFWRLFFYTGITQNDTVWIVLVMLTLFFMSVFLFPQNITMLDAAAMLLVIFSPAAMLLYERGNVDLLVFFLCAMIVLSADYSPYVTAALIVFAAIVKLFPFFGVTVLLKESKSKFIGLFLACLGALVIYLLATAAAVKASWNLTQRGDQISYGADVFFLHFSLYFSQILHVTAAAPILKDGPIVLAFVLIMAAAGFGSASPEPLTSSSARNLAAFRMGASIYAGTFLLGNNWDYRLAFLILVMPQLLQWSRITNKHYRITAVIILILIFVSCWHFIVWFAPSLVNFQDYLFVFDELANWMLVVGLSYLLSASLPDWMKERFYFIRPVKVIQSNG